MKLKSEDYLRGLYKDAYQIGAIFHLTRYKTQELEEKISEARRKFQVCMSVLFLVVKNSDTPGLHLLI